MDFNWVSSCGNFRGFVMSQQFTNSFGEPDEVEHIIASWSESEMLIGPWSSSPAHSQYLHTILDIGRNPAKKTSRTNLSFDPETPRAGVGAFKGRFTHETENPWPSHFKHSHWWKRRSRSKFASHYTWGTNSECRMDVKSTWILTWHRIDHVSCSLGLFSKTTSWR